MENPTRNQIFEALFALVSTGEGAPGSPALSWGPDPDQRPLWTSRRVRMWDDLPAKPALCQLEPFESMKKTRGMPYRWTLDAEWWVFHEEGSKGDSVIPTIITNDIVDALEAALSPPAFEIDERQTLGGLVYDCYIEGQIVKVAGDIVGQALICVPIKILVP